MPTGIGRYSLSVLWNEGIKADLGVFQTLVVILPEKVRETVGEERNRVKNAIAIDIGFERRKLAGSVLPNRFARTTFQCQNVVCRAQLLHGRCIRRASHHARVSTRLA